MNIIMAPHPPARSRDRETTEADIAQYVADTEPLDVLVTGGYLTGTDGRLVARKLRAPQLHQALALSVCNAVQPDVEDFYQEDDEPDTDWRQRGARTVRDHCTVCPVRAACAELALRDNDIAGIRGGLLPEELDRRQQAETTTLANACAEDDRAAKEQWDRIDAAAEVQRLARQYVGGSVPVAKREDNRLKTGKALRRRDALVTAHRLTTGWTEAA
ncbi:WhiB family transcriptional regulator [Streptomyces sp. NPDC051555]|uniref:WhiB family transcriptional regulator n=1 Tax=Streptomyces sp. NPDC051555 TaxID=3365657 RepID=UPI00379069FC